MRIPLKDLKPPMGSVHLWELQPLPKSSANETIPEAPGTMKAQLDQLTSGDRRVVMFPKGTPLAKRPAGMKSYQDADGNIFIYDPKRATQQEIDAAAQGNRLPDILGPADGGMGVPDKTKLQGEPAAVVARDAKGQTVQGSVTDQPNLPRAIAQAEKVTPEGGRVSVESPKDELAHRMVEQAGGQELTRGTSDIPMDDRGRADVAKLGEAFTRKGGLDKVYHGPLERTRDTAELVGGGAPQIETEGLRPWALGDLEGQPNQQTEGVVDDLMKKRPDMAPPGQGPLSEYPGESHQEFIDTVAGAMRPIMADFERDPSQRIGVVTHSRDLRVLRALLDAGFPETTDVDAAAFSDKVLDPGEVARLSVDPAGKWKLEKADISGVDPLEPGIYVVRHGETEWNKGGAKDVESSSRNRSAGKPTQNLQSGGETRRPKMPERESAGQRPPAAQQPARSALQVGKHPAEHLYSLVRQGNFKRAIDVARLVIEAGLMTDNDVDKVIDHAERHMGIRFLANEQPPNRQSNVKRRA